MIKGFPTSLIGFGVYSAIDLCSISDIMDDTGIYYISIEQTKDGVRFLEFREDEEIGEDENSQDIIDAIDLLKRNGYKVLQKNSDNGQKI